MFGASSELASVMEFGLKAVFVLYRKRELLNCACCRQLIAATTHLWTRNIQDTLMVSFYDWSSLREQLNQRTVVSTGLALNHRRPTTSLSSTAIDYRSQLQTVRSVMIVSLSEIL